MSADAREKQIAREIVAIEALPNFAEWVDITHGTWKDTEDNGHISLPIQILRAGLDPTPENLTIARAMAHAAGNAAGVNPRDGHRN